MVRFLYRKIACQDSSLLFNKRFVAYLGAGQSVACVMQLQQSWTFCAGHSATYLCRSRRRRKFATLMLIELAAQWINVAFFILPNAVLLARPCDLFTKLVREALHQKPRYEDASLSRSTDDAAPSGL